MLPSLREDYLEAILLFGNRHSTPPTCQDIATALHLPEPDVSAHLAELAAAGDLTLSGTGAVVISETGRETGQRVIKKHETLQCFLTEILGMDSSSASHEACRIEHAVSDETIDRLGNYLRPPGSQVGTSGNHPENAVYRSSCITNDPESISRTLADCEEGDQVVVCAISGRSCAKRLLDLGVVPGQQVSIKRKLSNRSLVVQVKSCDVALSPEIASAIFVERG
jgi:DtxR family transcriptional regulator, Mn-dependent transcriptional regulator